MWFLLMLFINVHIRLISSIDDGVCPNKDDNGEKLRCCLNFYLKESRCLECPNGTHGKNCSGTCPAGYFGKFCANKCACNTDQICSPERGCLNIKICNQRDCENGTHYNSNFEKQNGTDEDESSPSVILPVVLSVLLILIVLVLVGIFVGAYRRSKSKSILLFLRGNFNSKSSENARYRVKDTEKAKGDTLYDDIRESKMLNYGGTVPARYQDVKLLNLTPGSKDSVHYGHCDVGQNDVYNKLALRGVVNVEDSPYSAVKV